MSNSLTHSFKTHLLNHSFKNTESLRNGTREHASTYSSEYCKN